MNYMYFVKLCRLVASRLAMASIEHSADLYIVSPVHVNQSDPSAHTTACKTAADKSGDSLKINSPRRRGNCDNENEKKSSSRLHT